MILHSKVLGSSKNKIIILHGFLGSLDNWITFSKKISENDFEVHLLDQRNHGKSFHSNEFNYEFGLPGPLWAQIWAPGPPWGSNLEPRGPWAPNTCPQI